MDASVNWNEISGSLQIALGALVAVQLGLQIYALVMLFRTPDDRLHFGKKWPWALIIVFLNLLGAIGFLAFGRKPAQVADPLAGDQTRQDTADGPTLPADRAQRAAEVLYGTEDGDKS